MYITVLYQTDGLVKFVLSLDGITDLVVEIADTGIQSRLVGLVGAVLIIVAVTGPALAVKDDGAFAVIGIQSPPDLGHGIHIMDAHQVEAEAVQVVLACPVVQGIHHEFAVHGALASGGVAAAGLVVVGEIGINLVIIVRHDLGEIGICRVVGVVVNHIHDDLDARVMQCLDHLLHLRDADVAVVGIAGVGALRHIVVFGIVAPVVVFSKGIGHLRLVHGCIVIHREDLDMGDSQLFQVVDTGGDPALSIYGCALGEGFVFSTVCLRYAGAWIDGEVTDVHLPHDDVR